MIRSANQNDLERLSILFDKYRVFYAQESDIALARKFMCARLSNQDSTVFVWEEGADLLGFVQLYPSFSSVTMQRLWILNDLYVCKKARGKGIGASLLTHAESFAKSDQAKGLTLQTATKNHVAQKLYEKCDWSKDNEFVVYHKMF